MCVHATHAYIIRLLYYIKYRNENGKVYAWNNYWGNNNEYLRYGLEVALKVEKIRNNLLMLMIFEFIKIGEDQFGRKQE